MSMQGPRSLSNACTSITVLLKRGARENEFSTPIIQSHFPHANLFLHIPIHLRESDCGMLGAWKRTDVSMWVQPDSVICDFAEPSRNYSLGPGRALDTWLRDWSSHRLSSLSARKCLLKGYIHPFLVGPTNCSSLDVCENWWNESRLTDGKKKYCMLGKKVFMHKEFIFLT